MRTWTQFERFAGSLLGGVPFDDLLPARDQLFIKHHGRLGDCMAEQCGCCEAFRRDLAAHNAGQHVHMTHAEERIDRALGLRPYDPFDGLPANIDRRSKAAMEWVEDKIRRERGC